MRSRADEVGFLRAIHAEPGSLGMRGIYADWLEDRGDPKAAVMRLMLDLTALTAGEPEFTVKRRRLAERSTACQLLWLVMVQVPVDTPKGLIFHLRDGNWSTFWSFEHYSAREFKVYRLDCQVLEEKEKWPKDQWPEDFNGVAARNDDYWTITLRKPFLPVQRSERRWALRRMKHLSRWVEELPCSGRGAVWQIWDGEPKWCYWGQTYMDR
jgi:uncharacterized protein (TIGR02996 family)